MILNIIIIILFIIHITVETFKVIRDIKKEKSYNKDNRASIDTNVARILLEENFVNKVNNLIDSLIREQVDVYQVMILARDMSIHYIKSEDQDKMTKYIVYMVMKNISPDLRELIGLVYDTTSEEDLRNVINIRTKLYLINFITEYNKEFDDNDINL